MRRRKGTRVRGPYPHPRGFHVVVFSEGGRSDRLCQTEEEAHQLIRDVEKALELEGPITVEEAMKRYEAHKRAKGNRASSILRTMYHLRSLVGKSEGRLVDLAGNAATIYETYAPTVAVDTHRNALSEAKTFGNWCVKQGWVRQNPWAKVEGTGERRRGKEQLRVDEARRWLAKATELAELGDEGAVAAMMCLLLGLRASEVVERVGRDVDDGGALLWIDRGKTAGARRCVEVPKLLQGLLVDLAADMDTALGGRSSFLFPSRSPRAKLPHRSREWVLDNVKRLCRLAGVPVVTAHGLRGTMSSIASAAGAVTHLVAATLGHAGTAVTLGHYIRPEAAQRGTQERGMRILRGGKK